MFSLFLCIFFCPFLFHGKIQMFFVFSCIFLFDCGTRFLAVPVDFAFILRENFDIFDMFLFNWICIIGSYSKWILSIHSLSLFFQGNFIGFQCVFFLVVSFELVRNGSILFRKNFNVFNFSSIVLYLIFFLSLPLISFYLGKISIFLIYFSSIYYWM